MKPTIEQRVTRARTILRVIWQGYDAGGHSYGHSRTCGYLETAMDLLGPPDPAESQQADQDMKPLLQEAKEWANALSRARMDAHFRSLDEGAGLDAQRIAAEIDEGFEGRMR